MNAKAIFEMYDEYMAEINAEKEKALAQAKMSEEQAKAQYSPEPTEIKKEEKKEVKLTNVNVQSDLSAGQSDAPDDDGRDSG